MTIRPQLQLLPSFRLQPQLPQKSISVTSQVGIQLQRRICQQYVTKTFFVQLRIAAMESADWPPLVREISHLRERMAGMGSINLVAVEEYSSLRDRHDFLTKQSDDLWKVKEELTKAINELNETSLRLFTETFEQIRKNFKFTFERLFVGGFADLQLVQAEDPLESGIEIIAQPPGTKLRGISLLSGGQRTMTAVALLFGIYMVKPSPLCEQS
jgi:chromosome segregation protein